MIAGDDQTEARRRYSAWEQSYEAACGFAQRKATEHLHRLELTRRLSLAGLAANVDSQADLVALAGLETAQAKVEDAVHRQLFVGLKAEFELFLNRLCWCAWRHHFDHLVARDPGKKLRALSVSLAKVARWDGDVREHVIDEAIPSHGLARLCEGIKLWNNVDVVKALNSVDHKHWPQVKTAFHVRHLIEHRNGRIDLATMSAVRPLWGQTSWSSQKLERDGVVMVTPQDFEATHRSLVAAVEAIGGAACTTAVE